MHKLPQSGSGVEPKIVVQDINQEICITLNLPGMKDQFLHFTNTFPNLLIDYYFHNV